MPQVVKAAVNLMRARFGEPLTIREIAAHCGVAERTLNEQFRRFLRVSPGRYLRKLRLAAARDSLVAGALSGIKVTDVAQRCGFRHFGRFARQYRDCFGETPSATLRHARQQAGQPQGETVPSSRPRAHARPTITVLPLSYPVQESRLGRIAMAVAEDLAEALCRIGSIHTRLEVAPRAAARQRSIGGGAGYFLAGSVSGDGPDLRIALQLVESSTGNLVWGERVAGRVEPWAPIGRRTVERLRQVIVNRVIDREIDRASRTPSRDLDAHGLGMHALGLIFRSRPDATRRALDLLYPAVERDPDDALITALAAWAHAQLVMYNDSSSPGRERVAAIELNRRAAVLDEGDPKVLTARSSVHTMAGEFDDAAALVSRALAMDPTSGWAWGRSAWLRAYAGDYRCAIVHFRRALGLHAPAGVRANALVGLGTAHFGLGDYVSAASCLRRAIQENPGMWWANRSLSVSLARIGERKTALKALARLRRHRPDLTVAAVVQSVPFEDRFLNRIGEGLDDLGLPP